MEKTIQLEVESITNKIINYIDNIKVLSNIQDNALEEDLMRNNLDNCLEIVNTVSRTIEPLEDNINIQVLNLQTLYMNSSEEERSIIKTNLLNLINEHSEIEIYIQNFIEIIN